MSTRSNPIRAGKTTGAGLLFVFLLWNAEAPAAETKPASFYREVYPIFKRSCTGCHHPGKLKGQLDVTTYPAFQKGGKHGAAFTPGDPAKSRIIEEISGAEPNMPKEGDPLSKEEVALLDRWIREGAKDDTPADAFSFKLSAPPVYSVAPVVPALAYSPDGKVLAVSSYHEIILHQSDGSALIARLVGESSRLESLAFSGDGKLLAAAGGAPSRFGEIQIWDTRTNGLIKALKISTDSLYGVCFSADASRVAFGCADKSVRILSLKDDKELVKFDNHSDWVFGTTFTVDGKRLLTGSRDRAMKLIDASNGQFIDDINKLLENVLCLARHPKEDLVIYGGEMGTARIYKIAENQGRTAANNDVNLVREFERLPGAVQAVDFSPDGNLVAVGGVGEEVRLFNAKEGKRTATLKGHEGAIFAVKFHPLTNQVATAGFDGKVRIYNSSSGQLIKSFVPVPLKGLEPVQQAAK